MEKQRRISFFLLCVFSITFIHSILPHHHDDEFTAGNSISYFSSASNNSSPFETAFSYYQHDLCGTIVIPASCSGCSCCSAGFDNNGYIQFYYSTQLLQCKQLKYFQPNTASFTSLLYASKKLLRGPPVVA